MQKSSLRKILSAVTIFAVAVATTFSVPVSVRAEEEAVVEAEYVDENSGEAGEAQADDACDGETAEGQAEDACDGETAEGQDDVAYTGEAAFVDENEIAIASEEPEDIEIVGESNSVYSVEFDVTYKQTEARRMLAMINDFRTGSDAWAYNSSNQKVCYSNLSAMTYDYNLEKVAMQRATEIALSFARTRPSGRDTWTAYSDLGYSGAAGENIAVEYMAKAEYVFEDWQETNAQYSGQGHRRNMLAPDSVSVGIACVYHNGLYYWVQEFSYRDSKAGATTANDALTTTKVDILDSYIESRKITAANNSVTVDVGKSVDIPSVSSIVILNEMWNYKSRECKVRPTYTYKFSDTSVAEIRNGQIYGLKAGTTTLTISALGTSTDVAVTVKSTDISLEMTGVNIDILDGGSADLYIHFQTSTAKKADTSLKVVMKDSTGKELDTKTYNCADYAALNTTADGVVNYKISYPMAVTDMNKNLEVSVCYKGTAVSTKSFSVEEYLYLIMEQPPNEKTKNICIALLNYGAAVQEYFDIDTDKLVNRNLTASQKQVTTITKSMVEGYTDDGLVLNMATGYIEGLSYLGTSLVLDGVGGIKLRVYMMVDADRKDSLKYYPQNGSTISWKQNLFYADMPIKIGECNEKDLVLQVAEMSNGAKVNEVYSCPYVYMNAALNQSNPNAELIALLSALYQLDKVCRG